jgi:hypothetical protein
MQIDSQSTTTALPVPSWKVFGSGTPAGRLLARLYGVDHVSRHCLVTYPKLKKLSKSLNNEAVQQTRPQWRNVGNAGTPNTGTKLDKAKAVKMLSIPKVGRRSSDLLQPHTQVENIPRRKSNRACKVDVETIYMKRTAYRPPCTKAYTTDQEKERLNEIFTCKGGYALPEELTFPITETSSDVQWRKQESRRVQAILAKRRVEGGCPQQLDDAAMSLSTSEMVFNDLVQEVKERRYFQFELKKTGCFEQEALAAVTYEISSRIQELQKIDPNRTKQLINELYGGERTDI